MKRVFKLLVGLGICSAMAVTSCTKNDDPAQDTMNQNNNGTAGRTTLQVRLKDAPTAYDSVVVDIQQVLVSFSADSLSSDSGWDTLATNAGLYDLLSLQNGIDTLLASSSVPLDTLTQVRLVLGSNNYIVDNGTAYPLFVPSGSQSGLKLNCSRLMNPTLNSITIDFDAAASVRKTGNGVYILRPVLLLQ